MNAKWFKVLAIPMVLCMLFVMVGAVSAQTTDITLCHATGSTFNEVTVDRDSTDAYGHGGDSGDIIPAYHYDYYLYWIWHRVGDYPGKNLAKIYAGGVTGQQILNNH